MKTHETGSARIGLGLVEFIVTIALMTASIALAIDSMVAALPNIGHALGVTNPNDVQLVIGVYFLGFGVSQLFFGNISDTFGRRPVLLGGFAFYTLTMLPAAWTTNFETLLILRFAQGIGAAAVRITTMAIVRDCFGGREMAQVMSYVMIVFMLVPIIAPSIGQLIVTYANWQWIFILLGSAGAILFFWAFARMKESLPKEERLPLSPSAVASGFRQVFTNRVTFGYMIGLTLFNGVICAYVVTVQQIFVGVYELGSWMPIAFAGTAIGIAIANLANGFCVRAFGMRRISHAAMILFTLLSVLMLGFALMAQPPFFMVFIVFTLLLMMFAVIATNFTAICLEPMGHIAGTATAITGALSTSIGALLGGLVGQLFNGTVQPIFGGFALAGLLTIVATLWAENGRLFTHPGDEPTLDPGAAHV